jgi:hypothetical protein
MDARSFIVEKNAEAVEELRAIDAEYFPRRKAALAAIALAERWLDELVDGDPKLEEATVQPEAVEPSTPEPSGVTKIIHPEFTEIVFLRSARESTLAVLDRQPEETWRSARDLQPRVRHAS